MYKKYQHPTTHVHHCTMVGMLCLSGSDEVKRTSGNADFNYAGGGAGPVRAPHYKGVFDED